MRLALPLLMAPAIFSATLKPQSLEAWNRYFEAANAYSQQRAAAGGTFLWVDESAERRQRVKDGEIVIAESNTGGGKKAPSALIHHWIGAAFLPGAKVEDAIAVVRDYDKYREYYRPAVVSSHLLAKSGTKDHYSLIMVNEALVLKTAVETECHSIFTQVDEKRWYSATNATHVSEIQNFGRSGERRLPEDTGGGYVWRAGSITRFEERDNGVYVELEVLALSRDIPFSVRFIVEPIVRRLSRTTLAESLRQTGKAARSLAAASSHASGATR